MPPRPNPKGRPVTAPHQPDPKGQYHHFIPRFVLRRFQCDGRAALSTKERRKAYRQTGNIPEFVHFYSLATGKLDQRPIDSVYGVRDLYKDASDADNVYKIEQDFSKLENRAARVIDNIHTALPSGAIRMKRRDLNDLRKFMFIMHFRQPFLSTEYYSEEQPTNASSRDWFLSYRQRHGLKSATDQWLRALRYYLTTPHGEILLTAQKTMKKHGGPLEYHRKMFVDGLDPNEDHTDAIAYDKQGNFMYLGLWEAADGDEFVLSSSSFGLWEGLLDGRPEIHRLFLFSPRILVVLRMNDLRPEGFEGGQIPADVRNAIYSPFFDMPLPPPVNLYRSQRMEDMSSAEMDRYLTTPAALDDVFDIKITKLTPEQTYTVNHTLMINVRPSGSITFTDKEKMRKTLLRYVRDPLTTRHGQLTRYRYLLLLPEIDPTLPQIRDQTPDTVFKEPGEIIDIPLFTMVINIVTGVHMYGSRFNRAFLVFMHLRRDKAKKTEFLSELHYSLKLLRSCFLHDEDKLPLPRRSHAHADAILKSTPDHIYEPIFRSLLNWGLKQSSGFGHSTDPLIRLRDEVVIVSFIDWTVRMYPDVYDALVGGTHDTVLKFDGPVAQPKSKPGARVPKSKTKQKPSDPDPVVELGPLYSDGEILGDYIMARYVNEIIAGDPEFRSDYDRAMAVHKLAISDEEMQNVFSDLTRTILPKVTARVIESSGASGGSTAQMVIAESCSPKESKAFFDVMFGVAKNAGYGPPLPRGTEKHEEKFVDLLHEVMLVGLAKALARERSDILRDLFTTGDLQGILLPLT